MTTTATLGAHEFADYADRAFGRLASRLAGEDTRRLLVKRRIRAASFARLRAALANYIAACLGLEETPASDAALVAALVSQLPALPNVTPNGVLCAKHEHNLEFNLLHRALVAAFDLDPVADLIDTMHVPLTVRIVDGSRNATRDNRPYATSTYHSDVWAGEPLDAVVVHTPVFGNIGQLGVEFAEMPRDRELDCMRIYDAYRDAELDYARRDIYRALTFESGFMYYADPRLLHRTLREGPGIRVGIDFRFRLKTDGAFRAIADQRMSAHRTTNYVSPSDWAEVGRRSLVWFDESMEEAGRRFAETSSSTRYVTGHRMVAT